MSDALKIVTHEDTVLAKKPVTRVMDQSPRSELDAARVDPSRLMDMLGDIDGLKHEIQERMRRIEAVKQAKSLLMEDATRTEALTRRLSELGKVMTAVQSGVLAEEVEPVELARGQARDVVVETELRPAPVRVMNESVALVWPRPEDSHGVVEDPELGQEGSAPQFGLRPLDEETQQAIDAALQRLEQAEETWKETWKQAEEATLEAKRLVEESTAQLEKAAGREAEVAADYQSAREALASVFESSDQRMAEAEEAWRQAWAHADEVTLEARRLMEESASQLQRAAAREQEATAEFQSARAALASSLESTNQRMAEAEVSWKLAWTHADEVTLEAKRLMDESAIQLHRAVAREEEAAAEFQSARTAMASLYDKSNLRLEEAERRWMAAEQAAQEAKRLFDETSLKLKEVEGKAATGNGHVSAETQAAIESALERLSQAEASWVQTRQLADQTAVEAKRLFDESVAQLNRAVSREEKAAAELHTAHEALTGAYESSKERLAEAERSWKRAEESAQEAKRISEETSVKLNRTISVQEKAIAEFQAAQKAQAATYQATLQRLEEAEKSVKGRDDNFTDVRQMWDLSTSQLTEAKNKEESAAFDLNSARQELTTAYQFAAVAAQRRLDSVELFTKAARWMILSVAGSWLATVWVAWFAFRASFPIWVAGILTAAVLTAAILIGKKVTREA